MRIGPRGGYSLNRSVQDCQPVSLSIIVVSDYAAGGEKSWEDFRRALRAWVNQEGKPADEFIIAESSRFKGQIPDDAAKMVPNMKVLYLDAESSYELKNQAVDAATGNWVVIVDADCIPQHSWLRVLRATIAEHPNVAAISAKTMYEGRSRMERLLGLLSRSYLDPGRRGPSQFVSGNAVCYRREVYRRHPLPVGVGPFASRIQSEEFLRDGEILFFDPALVVLHDFEGWPMERDIRRNHGYGTIITRLHDGRLPYASLIRAGVFAIPLIVAGKILNSVRDCFRCFRQYNVKSYELPLTLALAIVTHFLEVPGMLAAYRGHPPGTTAYR
ncbi:MAG: glycosyltransferase [Nitrospira sp. CR1.3]|nr:glycosyltransferase [Nitrospira sp. CR1.3]